jgi:hypothetical protein
MPDPLETTRDGPAREWLAKALAYFLFGHGGLGECAAQQREAALGWAEEWMEKPGNAPPLPKGPPVTDPAPETTPERAFVAAALAQAAEAVRLSLANSNCVDAGVCQSMPCACAGEASRVAIACFLRAVPIAGAARLSGGINGVSLITAVEEAARD